MVEQKAVKNVAVRDELEVMVKCPELALREVQALTDKQKAIADARILLATEVHKLREYAGMTRKAALKHIVDGVRMGALPDRIIEAANTANARQGKRTGVSTGSLDSWYSSWVMARGDANQLLALLAPGHHKETSVGAGFSGPAISLCSIAHGSARPLNMRIASFQPGGMKNTRTMRECWRHCLQFTQ
ncbi:hypothetical protein ACLBOM_00850 [Escherichia coli]